MFTYFAWSSDTEFNPSLSKFLQVLMRSLIQVGASVPLLALNGLIAQFGYPPGEVMEPFSKNDEDEVTYYRFPNDFPERLAALSDDVLAEVARRWETEDFWPSDINGFDLYGFLRELRDLCQSSREKESFLCCAITSK